MLAICVFGDAGGSTFRLANDLGRQQDDRPFDRAVVLLSGRWGDYRMEIDRVVTVLPEGS